MLVLISDSFRSSSFGKHGFQNPLKYSKMATAIATSTIDGNKSLGSKKTMFPGVDPGASRGDGSNEKPSPHVGSAGSSFRPGVSRICISDEIERDISEMPMVS